MISLYRELEYKELKNIILNGSILDIWGSKNSNYHKLIKWNNTIITANISQGVEYDIHLDLEKKFPIKKEIYDNILCLSVLEHIFNFQNVIDESFRIMKKWWKAVFATPFIFKYHKNPDDYFRYTESCLKKIFIKAGFSKENITIIPIGAWMFHTIYNLSSFLIPTIPMKKIYKFFLIKIDKWCKKISKKYKKISKEFSMGYITIAKK